MGSGLPDAGAGDWKILATSGWVKLEFSDNCALGQHRRSSFSAAALPAGMVKDKLQMPRSVVPSRTSPKGVG